MNRRAYHERYMAELYALECRPRRRSWGEVLVLAAVWMAAVALVTAWIVGVFVGAEWIGEALGRLWAGL